MSDAEYLEHVKRWAAAYRLQQALIEVLFGSDDSDTLSDDNYLALLEHERTAI